MAKRVIASGYGLFGPLIQEEETAAAPEWRADPLPHVPEAVKEIEIDFETTGLKHWDKSCKPFGFGYGWVEGDWHRTGYVSWGHLGDAPRHDEEQAKRWLLNAARGRRVSNAEIKFELHIAHQWGADLEGVAASVTDPQYHAALLDDHRKQFSQEVLCEAFLPEERKVLTVNGVTLDPSRMAEYHPGLVAVRAEADVRQVRLLIDHFDPQLREQNLINVRNLEDECIWATVEMERNGALIDVEKLRAWRLEARKEYERILMELYHTYGLKFNPASGDDWAKLFLSRGIVNHEMTKGRRPKQSFTDSVVLGAIKATDDPVIQLARRAGKIEDLLTKYLDKWAKTVGDDGILRFKLHQLRSDEGGTVSGRFASSAIDINGEKIGTNVQAILALEKQLEQYGPDWIIRELIIPTPGQRLISADAEQIEYRIFADRAANPRVLKAYRENPRLSFHKLIDGYLRPHKPDLSYKGLKNLNFMTIYGGGAIKLGTMLGELTPSMADELNAMDAKARAANKGRPFDLPSRKDPRMRGTMQIKAIYDRELPEVKPLLQKMTNQALERGFVTTISGRRARFIKIQRADGTFYVDKPHKALNADIQGSAGDIMKTKMTEVHKARKNIGILPRLTVHDQLVGDGDEGTSIRLGEVLDRQSFNLKVPILWKVDDGANWRECDEKK